MTVISHLYHLHLCMYNNLQSIFLLYTDTEGIFPLGTEEEHANPS